MTVSEQKKQFFEHFVSHGDVCVVLNTTVVGVLVPRRFKTCSILKLNIGLDMPIPIPDLEVNDNGIKCTLSFDHQPFLCRLPWLSIWQMIPLWGPKMGVLWKDCAPADVQEEIKIREASSKRKGHALAATKKRKKEEAQQKADMRSKFKVVDGGKREKSCDRKRPNLKIVKSTTPT